MTSITNDKPNLVSVLNNSDSGESASSAGTIFLIQPSITGIANAKVLPTPDNAVDSRAVREPVCQSPPKSPPNRGLHISAQNDTDCVRAVAEDRYKLPAPDTAQKQCRQRRTGKNRHKYPISTSQQKIGWKMKRKIPLMRSKKLPLLAANAPLLLQVPFGLYTWLSSGPKHHPENLIPF